MKNLQRFLITAVVSISLIAILSGTAAFGKQQTDSFIYLAALDPICGVIPCPDVAFSSTGERIAIFDGIGVLTVNPKEIVFGFGNFSATALVEGGDPVSGTWAAGELLSFKSYGPGNPDNSVNFGFPAGALQAGRAQIRIQLFGDDGTFLADAILEVNCLIPGAKVPRAAIEGVHVRVQDGLNFNDADPGGTLFIQCPTGLMPAFPC